MTFTAAAESYDAFMGRYSVPLAPLMTDFAQVAPGQSVLDVGCGPGALTEELVRRLGTAAVTAVDPAPQFVAAAAARNPGARVLQASAEELPFANRTFDAAIAQLVVHFMADPVTGLGEMARVTRPKGLVAASVWDYAGGKSPLSLFWTVALELDPDAETEARLAGAREGHLAELMRAAGLRDVEDAALSISRGHSTFEEWWQPYQAGVGPAGSYIRTLDEDRRLRLREACRARLPNGPFVLTFQAWAARGRV